MSNNIGSVIRCHTSNAFVRLNSAIQTGLKSFSPFASPPEERVADQYRASERTNEGNKPDPGVIRTPLLSPFARKSPNFTEASAAKIYSSNFRPKFSALH